MEYKPDWEETVERYGQWWNGEEMERPFVCIWAPKEKPSPLPPPNVPDSLEERFTNVDFVMANMMRHFESTHFIDGAFPCFWPNLGPDFLGALAGAELKFGEGTSWAVPFAEGLNDVSFEFDPGNKYWKIMEKLSREAAKNAPGRYIYGVTDLHPSLDALSAVRGPENLCMDMIDDPKTVKKALARATALFKTAYEKLYQIGFEYQPEGSTTTQALWSKGKYYINCCDFIYMISTSMFDEFAKPIFEEECEYFDDTIFHMDGIGSLNHLDSALAIKKLKAVQWAYGDGQPTAKHWIPVYKKILAAGKRVHAYGPPDDLPVILDELGSNGILYSTWCASKSEADDFLRFIKDK